MQVWHDSHAENARSAFARLAKLTFKKQLALAARADALVTGDGDLLTLAGSFAVPIVTPAALRPRLGRDRS